MYKGKIIYNPSGKAGEYSYWAANFYNGCSGDCSYCYMKKPPLNQVWSKKPTLKKCLVDETNAYGIFEKELLKNKTDLQKHGLFFNFNSDPFLKETFHLNLWAMRRCLFWGIPVKVLTKQTWWVGDCKIFLTDNLSIGFSLTGHDELEKGCSTNTERYRAMRKLKEMGVKTWASIEPIIDIQDSALMIKKTKHFCNHYKIGIFSKEDQKKFLPAKQYDSYYLRIFIDSTNDYLSENAPNTTVYWKDSILKEAGIDRNDLPKNCVNRDYIN